MDNAVRDHNFRILSLIWSQWILLKIPIKTDVIEATKLVAARTAQSSMDIILLCLQSRRGAPRKLIDRCTVKVDMDSKNTSIHHQTMGYFGGGRTCIILSQNPSHILPPRLGYRAFVEYCENWKCMMTSSNGNIFRVTGHLCGESTSHRWIPHTKASDA